VDRLVGTRLGEVEVGARAVEGRLGTLYAARRGAEAVTLEVLRAERSGDDEEVRASNAIKCAGIAEVFDFGQLADGRRYRVMEHLDGESLEQLQQRRGKLPAAEVVSHLNAIAEVLQAAHAWAIPHGNLGPSSVFLVRGGVKLIDFGLAKKGATPAGDLQALGALGLALLTGADFAEVATPAVTAEPLPKLLAELLAGRVADATTLRRSLASVVMSLDERPRGRARLIIGVLVAVLALGVGVFFVSRPEEEVAAIDDDATLALDDAPEPAAPEAPAVDALEPVPTATTPRPARPATRAVAVPSDRALLELISRLESRLRSQARPGDDLDQALFVLNKQRLRLSGSPTEQDRRDVAHQLAGWKRSYLKR
jgi:serine/threonine protein kinase